MLLPRMDKNLANSAKRKFHITISLLAKALLIFLHSPGQQNKYIPGALVMLLDVMGFRVREQEGSRSIHP
jgi:hypothetical protein